MSFQWDSECKSLSATSGQMKYGKTDEECDHVGDGGGEVRARAGVHRLSPGWTATSGGGRGATLGSPSLIHSGCAGRNYLLMGKFPLQGKTNPLFNLVRINSISRVPGVDFKVSNLENCFQVLISKWKAKSL